MSVTDRCCTSPTPYSLGWIAARQPSGARPGRSRTRSTRRGELHEDEAGFDGLHRALALYAEGEVDHYVATRAAAMLRDVGLPLQALSVLDAAVADPPPAAQEYWIAFERTKSLRWAGRLEEAVQVARGLLSKHSEQERSITDELAKLACRRGRKDEAPPLLEANIARYEAAGDRALAQQCRAWQANLRGEQRGKGGLLEDEWRAERRRSAIGAERLGVADASARAVASSIVQALEHARARRVAAEGSGATAQRAASPRGSSSQADAP